MPGWCRVRSASASRSKASSSCTEERWRTAALERHPLSPVVVGDVDPGVRPLGEDPLHRVAAGPLRHTTVRTAGHAEGVSAADAPHVVGGRGERCRLLHGGCRKHDMGQDGQPNPHTAPRRRAPLSQGGRRTARRRPRAGRELAWGARQMKVLPWPSSLSARSSPPSSSASSRAMARPRPVPRELRAGEDCTCSKGEDARLVHRRYPHPGVAHREGDPRSLAVDAERDLAAIGELDGVAEEIGEDLIQPLAVGEDCLRHLVTHLHPEEQALLAGKRGEDPVGAASHLGDLHRAELKLGSGRRRSAPAPAPGRSAPAALPGGVDECGRSRPGAPVNRPPSFSASSPERSSMLFSGVRSSCEVLARN